MHEHLARSVGSGKGNFMTNPFKSLKKANHEYLHSIWMIAQEGDMESLPPEDRLLAKIMLDHEEFHNQFEVADLLHDHKYNVDSEVNPFLHIILHQIIENQLESREPIEAYQFYNALKRNKVSRHERIHCMANILIYVMHDVLRGISEFDLERYKSLLRRYKEKKPDKIAAALEKEFSNDS
jgi:hypothetical protein